MRSLLVVSWLRQAIAPDSLASLTPLGQGLSRLPDAPHSSRSVVAVAVAVAADRQLPPCVPLLVVVAADCYPMPAQEKRYAGIEIVVVADVVAVVVAVVAAEG